MQKKSPAFIVIYGRRRIGKTALIEEFGKDKHDFIYYLADQQRQRSRQKTMVWNYLI